jgi:hypothetical protein
MYGFGSLPRPLAQIFLLVARILFLNFNNYTHPHLLTTKITYLPYVIVCLLIVTIRTMFVKRSVYLLQNGLELVKVNFLAP